jgi:hypothetical protein
MPEDLVLRLLPRRYRVRSGETFPAVQAPDTPIRLLICPVNFAGQGARWAQAAEENIPGVGSRTMAYRVGAEFDHDVGQSVPVSVYLFSKRWQKRQRDAVLAGFSHVIVEAGRNPFGRIFSESLDDQVAELRAAGISVAMLAHGTDVRLPSRHAAENPDSPYRPEVLAGTAGLEREAIANQAAFRRLRLPVFVSTPDLLDDLPDATWLPVVVNTGRWVSGVEPLARPVPVVVHVPSHAAVKGSDLIDPALRRLEEEGLIEYRRIERLPAGEMPAAYGDADIVLDQFRLGSYGVAACEAMSSGRIVVGHVSARARAFVHSATGRELPIVESTAADVDATVRRIITDRAAFQDVGARGREFVQAVHDGRRSADVLRPFLTGDARRD